MSESASVTARIPPLSEEPDLSSAPQEWLSELERGDRVALVEKNVRRRTVLDATTKGLIRELLDTTSVQRLTLDELTRLSSHPYFEWSAWFDRLDSLDERESMGVEDLASHTVLDAVNELLVFGYAEELVRYDLTDGTNTLAAELRRLRRFASDFGVSIEDTLNSL